MSALVIVSLLISVQWSKAYETAPVGGTTYADSAYSVAYDHIDKAFVVVGNISAGPLGLNDIFVLKISADSGKIIWAKLFGLQYDDYGRDVIVVNDPNSQDSVHYVVVGYDVASGNADIIAFELEADGTVVWWGIYSTNAPDRSEYAYALDVFQNDYIIVGKISPGPIGDRYGLPDNEDALALKIDRFGTVMWAMAYSRVIFPDEYIPANRFLDVTIDPANLLDFVAVGETKFGSDSSHAMAMRGDASNGSNKTNIIDYRIGPSGTAPFATAYALTDDGVGGFVIVGDEYQNAFVMNVSSTLSSASWTNIYTFQPSTNCRLRDIVNYYDRSSHPYAVTGFILSGPVGGVDIWTMDLQSNGNINWSKVLRGCPPSSMTTDEYGRHLTYVPDDSSLVSVGYTNWPSGWTPSNLIVEKMDTLGKITCPSQSSCDTPVTINAVPIDPVITGSIDTITVSLVPDLIDSITVNFRDSVICSSWAANVGESGGCGCLQSDFHIFVNKAVLNYTLSRSQHVKVAVYDASGKLIEVVANGLQTAGSHSLSVEPQLSSGVYFIELRTDEFTDRYRLLIVR